MKFLISFLSGLVVLSALIISPAQGADVVSSLEARYEAIFSLSADFTQVSEGLSSTDGKSGGKVYFKKPGKIRWAYTGDVTDEIIGDGKTLWFYQPDLNQAFKMTGRRPDISTDFLSGMGSIRKYFTYTISPAKKGLISIRLEPRKTHPQIKSLILVVDKKKLLVREFILKDHYGNTTDVSFSGITLNAPIGDKLFSFSPPTGTDVIAR